jgi:hypothetical protein
MSYALAWMVQIELTRSAEKQLEGERGSNHPGTRSVPRKPERLYEHELELMTRKG